MNWEAFGSIAEMIGAIGVIISLAYLAVQVRTNTRAIKGSSMFEAENSLAQANETILLFSDDLKAIILRAYDPSESSENFSEYELALVGTHFRAILQKYAGQYAQYKNGLLDEETWQNRLAWANGLIQLPVASDWWEHEKGQANLPSEFMHAVENSSLTISLTVATTLSPDKE